MPVPKATENTITTLLDAELKKLGVYTTPFASLQTPEGHREVDIYCQNAGGDGYPCEAKFTQNELISAISKIQNDYIKHYKSLNIKGGFAILHPPALTQPILPELREAAIRQASFQIVLMFPPDDTRRNFAVMSGSLSKIAATIAENVLKPAQYVEPNLKCIIRTLRESAQLINTGLRHLAGESLDTLFGGKSVFQNILQYEEGEQPTEDLRLASSYILVNQLLFYQILSRTRDYPEIDTDRLESASELTEYFERVLEVNYKVIYSYNVASWIPDNYLGYLKTSINVIHGINPAKIGGDLLGTIFHDLIPLDVRKIVAAYYTNPLAAELLASLAIHSPDATVADFSVGSGGLLVAAYRMKKRLIEKFSEEDHKMFLERQLLGIDVMPFAASVAASHLALQSPEYVTDKVRIAVWDSTELRPGEAIPSIAGLRHVISGQPTLGMWVDDVDRLKGVVSLTDSTPEEISLAPMDVVIMNPPFTRQERIPGEYKQKLEERFAEYSEYFSGQLGYHGYFVFLADKFLQDNGTLALVIPATVLRVQSFEGVRKLLTERYQVNYIITTWHRSAFSESTNFREVLLVATKHDAPITSTFKVASLNKLPTRHSQAAEFADVIHTTERLSTEAMDIVSYSVQDLARSSKNWFKFIALHDFALLDFYNSFIQNDKLVPLPTVTRDTLVRGFELMGGKVNNLIISSSPEHAIKSSDIWVALRIGEEIEFAHKKARELSFVVPRAQVRNTLRRASGFNCLDLTKLVDFIIVEKWETENGSDFEDFKHAVSGEIDADFLATTKRAVERRLGNVFVVRRLDISAPGTCALAFYSAAEASPTKLLWSARLEENAAKIITLFLNSTFNILQILIERIETRGAFWELSKYVLEDFQIPDPQKLSDDEKRLLVTTFDDVSIEALPSILVQLRDGHPTREKIDRVWMHVLDIKVDLDWLYDGVSQEIDMLKRMMEEGKDANADVA